MDRTPAPLPGRRLMMWSLAAASAGFAVAGALADATRPQVDFDIYRMGGADLLSRVLYSARLPESLMGGPGMHFTYPPFAAVLFWLPGQLSRVAGQVAWSLASVGALALLAALSVRMARPSWPWQRAWWIAAITLFPLARLEPVSLTVAYGQVNLWIALLVIADFSGAVRCRGRGLPRGILIGLAAAIKLTPLIFIPLLLLTRQVRAACVAAASFACWSAAGFALAPAGSRQYWSSDIFNTSRSGNLLYISNQDLHAVLQRLLAAPPPPALYDLVLVGLAAAGIAVAAWAYRASSPLAGIVTCAATGLVIAPVSWSHHYVWVVPALAWLALAADRPAAGRAWAAATAVVFWAAPIWWVPDPQTGYGGAATLIEGNAFFLAAAALPVLVAVMLWLRRARPPLAHPRRQPATCMTTVEASSARPGM